jgi:hypothetical protein
MKKQRKRGVKTRLACAAFYKAKGKGVENERY